MAKKGKSKKKSGAAAGAAKNAVKNAVKSAKRFFLYASIAAVALVLFAIIFPLVHKVETLDPRAATKEGAFIDLDNGLTLHYYEAGKGEPVVMVHGFLGCGYTWRKNIPALTAAGYHVFAPDLPGFGFSGKPRDIEYNYKTFADALNRFLDAKGVKRATLIGNSMGGGVSIRFALDYPDRINKLILVDASGIKHDRNVFFKLITIPGVNSFIGSLFSRGTVMAAMKQSMFYDSKMATPEDADVYLAALRTPGSLNAAAMTMKTNKFDYDDEDFAKIKAPTLIIWGDKDKVISPAVASVFHHRIAGSQLVMIPKCGHLPQEEKPAEFNKIVLDFLKK
ncbi:MAG: alpha/beta hydrolase [bacterium]